MREKYLVAIEEMFEATTLSAGQVAVADAGGQLLSSRLLLALLLAIVWAYSFLVVPSR